MEHKKIIDINEQLDKNKKKPKRKIRTFVFGSLIFLTVIIIFYINSPLSRLSIIYFEGLEVVSRSVLIELSGLNESQLFITLNPSRISENLEMHPLIEQAFVRRSGLNSLIIAVTESQVVGCVDVEGELRYVLTNGETLGESHEVTVVCSDIMIRGLSEADLEGNVLALFVNSLMEVDEITMSLIQEVDYEPKHGDINRFSLFLKDGNTVKVNSYTMAERLRLYPAIAARIGMAGIFHFDVGNYFTPYHDEENNSELINIEE